MTKKPLFRENSILYGNENQGIEITENELYIYKNGKKHLLVARDGRLVTRACRCGDENTARGSYHLDEIEVSVCPKCGGLIVRERIAQ